jgi:hypothetical protein
MTRKHFKAIAETLATIKDTATRQAETAKYIEICRKANPRFDAARFVNYIEERV